MAALGVERENIDAGHAGSCAFGAGGDCTCGKWEVEYTDYTGTQTVETEPPTRTWDDDDIPF